MTYREASRHVTRTDQYGSPATGVTEKKPQWITKERKFNLGDIQCQQRSLDHVLPDGLEGMCPDVTVHCVYWLHWKMGDVFDVMLTMCWPTPSLRDQRKMDIPVQCWL